MSDPSSPELDPKLEEWLADAREQEHAEGGMPDLSDLLGDVERDQERAEKSPRFWLMSRPTWLRRLVACAAVVLIVVVGGVLSLREDIGRLPAAYVITAVGSLGFLLAAAAWTALRPLHRPPPPRWVSWGLVAATLGATFALALFAPPSPDHPPTSLLHEMVSPCLFYGLFLGLPVYLLLRLLDRGPGLTALIAACAAGLAGNLVLQLHCPRTDPEHLMGAHFSVALLFVVGLYLVHVAVRRLRS